MFHTKVVERIESHILYSVTFIFLNHACNEIVWENTTDKDRPQVTIWRMRIACGTPKAKHTQTFTIRDTHCFPTTLVTRTRLSITLHLLCLPCYISFL